VNGTSGYDFLNQVNQVLMTRAMLGISSDL